MAAQVTVALGPARSGKTQWLLSEYRRTLRARRPGAALWLSPTSRAAQAVRNQLLTSEFRACFSPNITTFARFADMVVDGGQVPYAPIWESSKRYLVRRLLAQLADAGRLRYYGSVARAAGIVHRICGWLSELKRLDIWPEQFRRICSRRSPSAKNEDLCTIYESYQEVLTENQLYDAEGRFWQARLLLRENQAAGFEQLRELVVDGFTDFTPPQHEILEILAARLDRILISLPAEKETLRADLFGKSLETLDQLRRRLGSVEEKWFARPAWEHWPAMGCLEAALFASPRSGAARQHAAKPHAAKPQRMEILAASSQRGEVELVASRIKQLLVEGDDQLGGAPVRPGEVVVVFRTLEAIDELVRETFGRKGIPFVIESGRPLARSRTLRALVDLLRLHVEDWPFRRLLAVLGSGLFQPTWPQWQGEASRLAAERVIRQLQVPQGRDELLRQLGRSASRELGPHSASPENAPGQSARLPAETAHADRTGCVPRGENRGNRTASSPLAESDQAHVYCLLLWLKNTFDSLPRRATPAQWTTALKNLARETGMAPAAHGPSDDPSTAPLCEPLNCSQSEREHIERLLRFEQAAWDELWETMDAEYRLQQQIGHEAPELSAAEMLAELVDLLAETSLWQPGNESGCVRVLHAAAARAMEIPYLFLAGLTERSFPAPEPQAELHTPAEREQLIYDGLPLPSRGERSSREMLLFYEVVTRATRRIWLSYPALDEKAQPLLPSPYLSEVLAVFGEGAMQRQELLDLSPVVRHWEPLCGQQLRTRAVAEALGGNKRLLSVLKAYDAGRTAESIVGGLAMVARREQRGFGPAEGMLEQGAIQADLAASFGGKHTFSATELESFAACPFRYFLSRVLGLGEAAEPGLATDFAARGILAHRLTARLHRELKRRFPNASSPHQVPADALLEVIEHVISAETHFRGGPVEAALAELDRRRWRRWAETCAEQFKEYHEKLSAEYHAEFSAEFVEVSFGRVPQEEDQSANSAPGMQDFPSLELRRGNRRVRIAGRIDRIDTGRVGNCVVFHVIDYKTGSLPSTKPAEVAAGYALQLPLYVLAAERVILANRNAAAGVAGYWSIGDSDDRRSSGFSKKFVVNNASAGRLQPTDEWTQTEQAACTAVFRIVDAIHRGCFPVFSADDRCTETCPYATICRVNQARSLEKQWTLDSLD